MNKSLLKIATASVAIAFAISGCTTAPGEEIQNSVNIIEETGQSQSPDPTETQAGENNGENNTATQQPAAPVVNPTKPSDFNYPELPTDDALEMLMELAKNTRHSTTTLGALEKYTKVSADGTIYDVTIAFDPTIGGNNLAVLYDYPKESEQEDMVFSINQVADERYHNAAEWLLGHQTIVTAQLTGKITAEIKEGYIEVLVLANQVRAKYYHEDKVITRVETAKVGEPETIRTIEYKKDGEVAELIAQIQ